MKKYLQSIVLFVLLLSACFLQGQEVQQIAKQLEKIGEIINQTPCRQKDKDAIDFQFKNDLKKAIQTITAADTYYSTPLEIPISAVIDKEEYAFTYTSAVHDGLIIKRRIKHGAIPTGGTTYEEFTLGEIKIKVGYHVRNEKLVLYDLQTVYENDLGTYFTRDSPFTCKVFTKKEDEIIPYANKRLTIRFDYYDATELNDVMVIYQGRDRYNWYVNQEGKESIRCFDENGDEVMPTKSGNDIEIKPTTYLLWYKGFIGKHPIKLMLKRGFDTATNDDRISEMAYGYDSQKKWIYLQDIYEPQDGINGSEKDGLKEVAEWNVDFEYNQVLKGDWDNLRGEILPITLTPMAKEFPKFTFKAQLKEELAPSGTVNNQLVQELKIYDGEKIIQAFKYDDPYDLEYYNLSYADMNYDGYLDLIINNAFFIYNSTTKTFDDHEFEEDYFPYLTELSQYNLFTKSFTAQMNRTMIEYRADNGKFSPYHSSSYYPNADGDMVMLEEKYVNGKWVTVEERIEKMEYDEPLDDDMDIASAENYDLDISLNMYNKSIPFSPDFYNKTGLELAFKHEAKLYVEMTAANGESQQQFLYEVGLGSAEKQMLDDNYVLYNGKEYFLSNWNGILPFFPPNLQNGAYTFRLVLNHPLFENVYSNNIQLNLPLDVEIKPNIKHLNGNINTKVMGDLYFEWTDNDVSGTFINAKTDQRIKLKGTLKGKALNLEEYEKEDILSGYFEGEYNNGTYKGFWLSPDKKIKVPFEFKTIEQ